MALGGSCPHNELIETVDTLTTEQTAFGEVIGRERHYDVRVVCADCGKPVNPYGKE